MWVEGHYEEQQLNYLLERSKSTQYDAFIDIGANFGLYTCVLGIHSVTPAIHSFECDPRNLYHLYGHLRMNNLINNVTVHPVAVGDKESMITFQIASETSTGHSHVGEQVQGYKHVYTEDITKNYQSITVQQQSIDNVFDLKDQNLMFKIDVEGYEKVVLNGMRRTLVDNTCLLQIEIMGDGSELNTMLSSLNYEVINKIGNDWYFTN
jgi:FkbM family methyltransferase